MDGRDCQINMKSMENGRNPHYTKVDRSIDPPGIKKISKKLRESTTDSTNYSKLDLMILSKLYVGESRHNFIKNGGKLPLNRNKRRDKFIASVNRGDTDRIYNNNVAGGSSSMSHSKDHQDPKNMTGMTGKFTLKDSMSLDHSRRDKKTSESLNATPNGFPKLSADLQDKKRFNPNKTMLNYSQSISTKIAGSTSERSKSPPTKYYEYEMQDKVNQIQD